MIFSLLKWFIFTTYSDVNNASSNMLLRESTELETADKTESEEEADGSMTPPVPTEFTYGKYT